ncbi:hypothetical protein DL93DRAFT_2163845 [Clavulina sp. PMI_390]|nr:hypothetical protein DL93DRAFT_2163845 [Clavulina sp. PMI_390]
MKRIKFFASRRTSPPVSSYTPPRASENARVTPLLPTPPAPDDSVRLPELPDDVMILILCHDLELSDFAAISKTCRRFHAIMFAELPWINLHRRLVQRGDLPRPIEYSRPLRYRGKPSSKGTTSGPRISISSESKSGDDSSARSHILRTLSVQCRIRTSNENIHAREISIPVEDYRFKEFVSMSMTAGGEALVIWMLSRLLVFDLRHATSLILHLDRVTTDFPQNRKFAVTLCESGGESGILIVGNFIHDTRLWFLFQALPGDGSLPSSKVQNYLVPSTFSIPSTDRITVLEFSERYVMIGASIHEPNATIRYYLQVHDLQGERAMCAYHPDPIQRAYFSGTKLTVCFNTGNVREYDVEVIEPRRLRVSPLYRSHAAKGTLRNTFCDPVFQTSNGSAPPELRCWSIPPHSIGRVKSLTLNLRTVKLTSVPDSGGSNATEIESSQWSALASFKLRSSKIHSQDRMPVSLSRIASSINRDRVHHIIPERLVAGKSTSLTRVYVPSLKSDMLVLSYASLRKATGVQDVEDVWLTAYKAVRIETPSDTLPEFTISGLGTIADFLWNEYTGQIVTATTAREPSSTIKLMVRIFQI